MAKRKDTRRQFLKGTVTVLGAAVPIENLAAAPAAPAAPADPRAIVAALGDTIIPTDGARYPGYKRLEASGISTQVLNTLRHLDRVALPDLALFNTAAQPLFGKTFVELDEAGRASYVDALFTGDSNVIAKLEPATATVLQRVVRLSRDRILNVFYRNFPYDHVDRDENGAPIPNQPHEIFQIKTGNLVTGWDIAGYRGPLTWEEEEERRNHFKQIRWQEELS
jgi:hypothetical protein